MTNEIKIWKCDDCKAQLCVCAASEPGPIYKFETCVNSPEPNWRITNEYKIVKNGNSKDIVLNTSNDKTPNCAICEWAQLEKEIDTDYMEGMLKELQSYIVIYCAAQGLRDCKSIFVYNSPECKKLFKTKQDLKLSDIKI